MEVALTGTVDTCTVYAHSTIEGGELQVTDIAYME